MNIVDVIVVLLLFVCMSMGYSRGVSGEVANIGGLLILIALYTFALPTFAGILETGTTMTSASAYMLAIITLSIFVGALTMAASKGLGESIKWVASEGSNKTLGPIISTFRGCVIAYGLLYIGIVTPTFGIDQMVQRESYFGRLVAKTIPDVLDTINQSGTDNSVDQMPEPLPTPTPKTTLIEDDA